MCCDSRCLFFIKVRTGSLIFGYIAAILSGIGVLVTTGLIFAFVTLMLSYHSGLYVVEIIMAEIFFFEMTAGFTCSVLLIYGIMKNKPLLVKTYVIYGMIHLVLFFVVVIIFFSTCLVVPGALWLIVCVIYLLCIYMVYLTYKTMTSEPERHSYTNTPNLLIA